MTVYLKDLSKRYLILTPFILLTVMSWQSCVSEFKLSDSEPNQIFIQAELSDDNEMLIYVDQAVPIGSLPSAFNPDQVVVILSNITTNESGQLSYFPDKGVYMPPISFPVEIEQNHDYQLSVSLPNSPFEDVVSETTVPRVELNYDLVFKEKSLVPVTNTSDKFHCVFKMQLDLQASSNDGQFFHVLPFALVDTLLQSGDTIPGTNYAPLMTENFALGESFAHDLKHKHGFIFDKASLPSGTLVFDIITPTDFDTELFSISKLFFEVNTVNREYYDYNLAVSKNIEADDTPVEEPFLSYSNITNGVGAFTAYSISEKEISL